MAGVRCIRKPASPGKPRPALPPCNRHDRCRTAAGSVTMPCPLRPHTSRPPRPCSEKNTSPALLCRSRPNKKREPFVPGKTAFRNPLCRTNAKIPDTASTAAKTGAQRGLKCFQRENLQKIRKNTGKKTRNGRNTPVGELSGRPYLMTKKSRCLTGNGIHIKIELVCALFSFSFLGRCLSGRSLGCGSFSCSCFSSRSSLGSRLA